ncbi:hypothetical protein N656DRAFT_795190 [Canariomyces notabilis]|uniref:G domain-containing protein n=1 Tax=Canariomyces notabilis TaxID=2074819 RepID=A0AAN6TK75_9PEZI|nr:hypothetical protein N656DRAFT_795190 [Canariomyces arenarius]
MSDATPTPIKDAYVAVVGVSGAGKSSFISTCAGKQRPQHYSTAGMAGSPFMYNDHLRVHLIDTPGFSDAGDKSDVEKLRTIAVWLLEMFKQGKKLSGVVFLHPISVQKPLGPSLINVLMFARLYGEAFYESVALVTSMWGKVPIKEGERREKELVDSDQFFGFMHERGSKTFRYGFAHDNRESALRIISHILESDRDIALDSQQGVQETRAGTRLEQVQLRDFSRKIKQNNDGILKLYREQINALLREIRDGAERQQKLTDKMEQIIECNDQEVRDVKKRMEEMEAQARLAQAELARVEDGFKRERKDREKAALEELERAKRDLTRQHQQEVERVRTEMTSDASQREKAVRDEMGAAAGKRETALKDDISRLKEQVNRAQGEVKAIQSKMDQEMQGWKKAETDLRKSLEQQLKEVERHRAELEKEEKAKATLIRDAEEAKVMMKKEMASQKTEMDNQRLQEVKQVREDMARQAKQAEETMNKRLEQQKSDLNKQHEQAVRAAREEMSRVAKADLEKKEKEVKAEADKLMQELKLVLEKKEKEMKVEREKLLQDIKKKEQAMDRREEALKAEMENVMKLSDENLKEVQRQIEEWEKERVERERQQKELMERERQQRELMARRGRFKLFG